MSEVKITDELKKCCICGKVYVGWGNNPSPIDDEEEHRCCDACNNRYVIPARILELYGRKEIVQEKR